MNAIPRIKQRPLLRPSYLNTTTTLRTEAIWIEANRAALTDWFQQLRSMDPEDFCDFADFCGVQFDREVELRLHLLADAHESDRSERREYSDFDRETGIPHHGEL